MKCSNCSNTIDQEEIYMLNKELINAIDTGELEEFTDLQDAMYQGMYCGACCREFNSTHQSDPM